MYDNCIIEMAISMITENMKYNVLYHGSPIRTNILKPSNSKVNNGWVYASPKIEFALAFCVRWDDNDITHGIVDDRFVIVENKPNAINIFNTKGYIHIIDDIDSFKPVYDDTDIELYTTKRIYVKDIIEINNVLDELYKYYEIYKYPNRPKNI
jgi:hypothetical protein